MRQQHNAPAPRHDDPPLPVDPGHVRALNHYKAMLAELKKEKGRAVTRPPQTQHESIV